MATRKGLLLTGGAAPGETPVLHAREEWIIVAADSGLDHAARYHLEPDAIVGDFDSLDVQLLESRYPGVPREQYDRAKDHTDTEIGLHYLWKQGVDAVTIVGGGGGRLDHLLGIVALFDRERYPRRWITDRDEVSVIDGTVEFEAKRGEIVSFFPAGPDTCCMRSHGLRWELTNLKWNRGDAGISNECELERCRVEIWSGRLLMVRVLNHPTDLL
jgi:thiamine pyrophosphokinase